MHSRLILSGAGEEGSPVKQPLKCPGKGFFLQGKILGCPYLYLHHMTELLICPIELHGVKINPIFFLRNRNFTARNFPILSIFFGWFWPYGVQMGKWAALSHDVGVNRDTLKTILIRCVDTLVEYETYRQDMVRFYVKAGFVKNALLPSSVMTDLLPIQS